MNSFYVDVKSTYDGRVFGTKFFDVRHLAQEFCTDYNIGRIHRIAVLRNSGKGLTPYQRVAEMNEAFGNAKGDANNIDWNKVKSQCKNLFDEYCELLTGLGIPEEKLVELKAIHRSVVHRDNFYGGDVESIRDALCDIQVFAQGAQHMMGYDGDNDMHDVVDGVMSRFIKDDADKVATMQLHETKSVINVYFEGEYPKMVMKSAIDQLDAPRGKVLKSASFKQTVFRDAP